MKLKQKNKINIDHTQGTLDVFKTPIIEQKFSYLDHIQLFHFKDVKNQKKWKVINHKTFSNGRIAIKTPDTTVTESEIEEIKELFHKWIEFENYEMCPIIYEIVFQRNDPYAHDRYMNYELAKYTLIQFDYTHIVKKGRKESHDTTHNWYLPK